MTSQEQNSLLVDNEGVQQDDQIDSSNNQNREQLYHSSSNNSIVSSSRLDEIQDAINPHRSLFYIIMLTIIIGGLQLSWCTEFSEGTPFLLSLGISKHTLALVWIAGPLSGSLGQPIIGIFSDNCQYRLGRRKPFIIGGCLATCFSLIYLSNSVDLIGFFYPKETEDYIIKRATIPFAALGVYLLDFSISAIQAASRAFIVDNVATHQQQIANAMAAIMIGGFNIIGYFMGSIKLTNVFPFLGNTQFKVLAVFASFTLIVSCACSLMFIEERDPTQDVVIRAERKKNQKRLKELGIDSPRNGWSVIISLYKQTSHSVMRLSPQVKIVCLAEFFAWIGYFPMLFYTTTYVGELYKYEFYRNRGPNSPPLTPGELQELQDESIRRGSMALLLHSITSFAIDLLLPLLVQPIESRAGESIGVNESSLLPRNIISEALEKFRLRFCLWLTVRRAWYISHMIFIACMVATFFLRSSTGAIFLFAVLGITWGHALWAPFVLISEEISRIKEIKARFQEASAVSTSGQHTIIDYQAAVKYENYEHEAGIILGIHNFFVAAPQVISSLLSSFLFRLLASKGDGSSGPEFDDSLGWVFRFGGFATIGALILSFKVKTNEQLLKEESEIFEHANV